MARNVIVGPGLQRLLAWLGLAFLLLIVGLGFGAERAGVLQTLPALTTQKVTAFQVSDTVEIDERGHYALYLHRPRGLVTIRWNGDLVERAVGEQSLVVPLEVSRPGAQLLELEFSPLFGVAGAAGDVGVGLAEEVQDLAVSVQLKNMGLILGIGLLAIVHLAVATRRIWRPDALMLGLLSAALAITTLGLSDHAYVWLHPGAVVRLRVAAELGLATYLWAFFRVALHPSWGAAAVRAVLPSLLLIVPAFVTPLQWMFALESFVVLLLLVAFLGCAVDIARAPHRDLAWVLLLVSLVTGVGVTLYESAVALGWTTGPSLLHLGVAGFATLCSTAILIRHAREAQRHQRLVEGSADAMLTVRPDGTVEDRNPSATTLLPPSIDNLLQAVHPDDRERTEAHLHFRAEGSDISEFRLVGTGEGGAEGTEETIVESVATPLDPEHSLLLLRNVTRRRVLDQGLIQVARMETVGLLLGGIAHDFNNLLGTLLAHVGFLQVILPPQHKEDQERLGRMEGTIERASLLTRRLLTTAGSTGSNLEAISLAEAISGAVALAGPAFPDGVVLRTEIADDLPPVLGATTDLEHLLVNVLMNARDAVGDRGEVVVRAQPFQTDDGGRGVVVAVDDDGPGIPEAIRDTLFEPFVTTKASGHGSGLGLTVARKIARDHYGRIWTEEREEGGARILLALRHADSVHEAPAPLPEDRSVLLVEDEEVLLEAYRAALNRGGYSVTACASGGDAWRWLQSNRPGILVTDVVMPGLSGVELATLCSDLYPDVPVLIVSGFIPERAARGIKEASWHRLNKPIRAARLVSTVGRLCRRAERARSGQLDITQVAYLFPPLERLSAEAVGL